MVIGGLNLGGSIDPVHNAVSVAELAIAKGATTLLVPVSARKQLNDLPDDWRNVCMNDTPPEIERMVRERIMARSAEERFIMGARTFDAALEMIRASLPADLSKAEQKRRLFERLYGNPASKFGVF